MQPSLIEHLVQICGIEYEYIDAWGNPAVVTTESLEKLLIAMGYPLNDETALHQKMNEEAQSNWLTMVEPVYVIGHEQENTLHFKLPFEFANDELHICITKNSQICKKIKFVPIDQTLLGAFEINDMEMQHYAMPVNLDLACGYYQLELLEPGIADPLGSSSLIITPSSSYQADTEVENTTSFSLINKALTQTNNSENSGLASSTLFNKNVSLGLAPSPEHPKGEDLKTEPMAPLELYKAGYKPVIELFNSLMNTNKSVTFNNVMSLLKQWWIVKGDSPELGCYVYYPLEDLLAILALESQLNKCAVSVEQTPDMPDEMVAIMELLGIKRVMV